jgi:O-antigen ligase
MGVPLAVADAVTGLGALAAALAAAGAFVLRSPRARALSALVAVAITPVLLVGELWNTDQISSLRDRPGVALGAAAAGLVAIAVLAAVFVRRPDFLPVLAVAALPFRIPVDTGGNESANLLVPLYLVVGAGVVAFAADRLRGGEEAFGERRAGRMEMTLVAAVALYALQSLYSTDFEQAVKNLAFFYVPFAMLLKLLTATRWTRAMITGCFALAVGLALAFAVIGFWEYAARDLLWNSKVIQSNQFESYFRVNSLFFDPNIYGRFLAVVMVGVAASLLWARRPRDVWLAAVALAVLWAGLVLTFSQSSFAALLVGLTVLAALRWDPRPVGYALAVAGVVAVTVVVVFPDAVKLDLGSERSLDKATSGRFELMEGGLSMFADRPLWGHGSGSFAERYRAREDASSTQAASASHTIPITIAAEQGIVGLAAYLIVLGAAFRLLFGSLGRLSARDPPRRLVSRAFAAAGFAALVFHTLLYAAFLEDPITWTLLGVGAVLLRARAEVIGSGGASASARTRTAMSTR